MESKIHWENIYSTKAPTDVSWYQPHAAQSLDIIARTGIRKTDYLIDVGGGASTLIDDLLAAHFKYVTVLDISSAAIRRAKERLGTQAEQVTWLEADITRVTLPPHRYDLWHDRAVFHFLTAAEDRRTYVNLVKHALKPHGHIIVATFAPDGPTRCSGLDVVRYDPDGLHDEFGASFQLIESHTETHATPFGTQQKFIYCYCKKQ